MSSRQRCIDAASERQQYSSTPSSSRKEEWMLGLESKINALEYNFEKRNKQTRRNSSKATNEIQDIVNELKMLTVAVKGKRSKAGYESDSSGTLPTVSMSRTNSADYSLCSVVADGGCFDEEEESNKRVSFSQRVSFSPQPTTHIWMRPYTPEDEISELYYSMEETERFREQYRQERRERRKNSTFDDGDDDSSIGGGSSIDPLQTYCSTHMPKKRSTGHEDSSDDDKLPSMFSPRPDRLRRHVVGPNRERRSGGRRSDAEGRERRSNVEERRVAALLSPRVDKPKKQSSTPGSMFFSPRHNSKPKKSLSFEDEMRSNNRLSASERYSKEKNDITQLRLSASERSSKEKDDNNNDKLLFSPGRRKKMQVPSLLSPKPRKQGASSQQNKKRTSSIDNTPLLFSPKPNEKRPSPSSSPQSIMDFGMKGNHQVNRKTKDKTVNVFQDDDETSFGEDDSIFNNNMKEEEEQELPLRGLLPREKTMRHLPLAEDSDNDLNGSSSRVIRFAC